MTTVTERQRVDRTADLIVSVVLLSLGLFATVGVAVIVGSWSALMGDVLDWARWMLLGVQVGLFVVTALICGWRLQRRKVAFVAALVGGAVATIFFWLANFFLVASLPCPSFC